jgi:hypothetical protein
MIKELLQELKPYSLPYRMVRVGNPNRDGGYGLYEKFTRECDSVYSFGVGELAEQVEFDRQMASIGKKVYMYDYSVDGPKVQHENFLFHKEFVSSKNAYEFLKINNDLDKKNLLGQFDIEGAEYEMLMNVDKDFYNHFSQLSIEFHFLSKPDEEKLECFRLLNSMYYIYHIHANNHTKVTDESGQLPEVLEISFLRKDMVKNIEPYLDKNPRPILGIDKPCCSWEPEIFLDWWCFDD